MNGNSQTDKFKETPLSVWHWGVRNRSGLLKTASPKLVYQALLPRDEGSISHQGIRFKGHRYQVAVEELKDEERRWYFAACDRRKKVTIAYDHRTTSYVYLCLPEYQWVRCELLPREEAFEGRDWSEIEDYADHLTKIKRGLKDDWEIALSNFRAHVDAIVQTAESTAAEHREAKGVSKTALEKNKTVYRAIEKVLERTIDLQEVESMFNPHLPFDDADLSDSDLETTRILPVSKYKFTSEILNVLATSFEEDEGESEDDNSE